MRVSLRLLFACAFVVCAIVAAPAPSWGQASAPASTATTAAVEKEYGRLPLLFEANRGQASDGVQFLSHAAGQLLLLEKDGAVLRLATGRPQLADAKARQALSAHDDLKIGFVGASQDAAIVPLDEQAGKTNYILGNDPSKWHTNVENYSRVRYNTLYPGVDLVFYGNPSRLEHDFIVAPGADYRSIALELRGSRKIRLAKDGCVSVMLANGSVEFSAPRIYQVRDGQEVAVKGGYTVKRNVLAFHVGAHDATLPLVIDPVLSYSTYLAGSQTDVAQGIALDAAGNAYVTGLTFSTDFPTLNARQPACDNCDNAPDVFVTKLNSTGTALVYSTYLGGSGYDQPFGIAVDGSGHAIVGGETSSTDFPLKGQTPTAMNINATEGFVTSLSKDGTTLNFSTLLGGGAGGLVSSVTTDSHANVYAQGTTDSPDFPVKPATNVIGAPAAYPNNAMFVAKFTATGSLVFGTTIGFDPQVLQQNFGSLYGPVFGNLIAVDTNEDVYISGGAGPGFLVTPGAFQTTYTGPIPDCGGCTMGFVAELKPDGSAFVFASYLGGSGGDQVTGLTLDANRNIYLTGNTSSTDFPVTTGSFQNTFPSGQTFEACCETFVTKMNPTGSALIYSSFLGGSGAYYQTYASGIAVNAVGEALVTGSTRSTAFPVMNPLESTPPNGSYSTYVTKFNSEGTSILFSTLFSGSTGAQGVGVALNAADANDVYVVGTTVDANLPTTPGAFEPSVAGAPPNSEPQHVFVTKFDLGVASAAACLSQTSLFFVSSVNKTSAPDPLVVTNCGNAPLTIANVAVAAPFKQTNNCSSAVQPGMSCTVNVAFRGTTRGSFTATLTISDNAPIQPLPVALTGQATAPIVQIELNPFTLDDQLVGQTGLQQALFIFNVGDDVLSITTVNESGADFSSEKQGCLNVQPSGACYILVTFHPVAAGLRTGTLTLIDNAPDSPQTVAIQGTGLTSYPVPTISSIIPNTLLQGSAAQVINVQGGIFFQTSKIIVNGTPLATTYDGGGGVSATIPASAMANLGELEVQVVTPTPGGGTSNTSGVSIYQVFPIAANNLIYEPYTRKLYASISSAATTSANSIVEIDPETETIGAPISVGAGPNHMALTADGAFLYVGLDGVHAIQQLKLPSGALGPSTSLATAVQGQPVNAYNIAVVPGKEQIYVASLQFPNGDPSEAGVALVSNGKILSTLPGFIGGDPVDGICYLSDPTTFYGSYFYGSLLYKFNVANYATLSAQADSSVPSGFTNNIVCDSRYIYDFSGHVFDPIANQLVGTYPVFGFANSILPDDSVARTYATTTNNYNILAFDQKSFTQVDAAPTPNNDAFTQSLLRWGTDGFAYLNFNSSTGNSDLVLMRSGIAQPSVGPNPVPTVVHSTPEVAAGHGNYQLTITGTNFVPGAVVEWNGAIRTTTFQNSTTLIADIPAADVAVAGAAVITVLNPPFSGNVSNQHTYKILAAQ
jgi:hypothetical protein